MHSAPSRIIPMYPEEGALHELGDAGGGKRVKDRAMLILSQFSALVHGPCGDGAGGLALCEKALADWFSSSTCRSNADATAWSIAECSEAGTRAALVSPAEEAWFNIASASAGRAVADLMWRAVVGSTGGTTCVVRTAVSGQATVRVGQGSDGWGSPRDTDVTVPLDCTPPNRARPPRSGIRVVAAEATAVPAPEGGGGAVAPEL
ncbi:hypothetical protein SAMN02787144_10697 [Streptomyces atratus]|uniref:Uncharacterized protein n=1 Tax=Streptomyces atratus TaxID=1893 RepID=A0A1K2FDS4_STRAR|nr:hypothetical protein SAMN02787144_10697 [Streptomyces atratus]